METKNAVFDLSKSGFLSSGSLRKVSRIAALTIFTALGAQFAARLPFTPVPVTMQTLFVVMAGIVLGPRDGFYAMLAYLGLGISGAPIFAGFAFGPAVLFGPTGGYLLAFPVAALVSGHLAEMPLGRIFSTVLAAACGLFLILVMGTLHISVLTGISLRAAAGLAFAPFIFAELVKCLIAGFSFGLRSRRA